MANTDRRWYRLDNAGRLFPALMSERVSTVFRVAAVMKKQVEPNGVQTALDRILPRFASFQVRFKDGLFWTFLEQHSSACVVQQETEDPCRPPRAKADRGYLFRVLVHGRRISLECSHALTDGMGAMTFFEKLLEAYVVTQHVCDGQADDDLSVAQLSDALDEFVKQPADEEESEDAYGRYFNQRVPPAQRLEKAARFKQALGMPGEYEVVHGYVPVEALKKAAKQAQLRLTEYIITHHLTALAACLNDPESACESLLPRIDSAANTSSTMILSEAGIGSEACVEGRSGGGEAWIGGGGGGPIRLMVPVNLRPYLPSKTVHNFFLPVYPEIDPRLGEYTFEEIGRQVQHDLGRMTSAKWMSRQIARNVKSAQHPLVRTIPNVFKRKLMPLLYAHFGSRQHSGVMSNLGVFQPKQVVADAIESMQFVPNPNPATVANLGVIAFKELICLTMASQSRQCVLTRRFFLQLRAAGLPLKMVSNRMNGCG